MALVLHLTGWAYFGLEVALVVDKYDTRDGYLPRKRLSFGTEQTVSFDSTLLSLSIILSQN